MEVLAKRRNCVSNREKPNLFYIVITAFITTVITLAVPIGVQWLSLESVAITISPSSELDGKYLTIISIQNLEKETLSNLSLYFDTNFDVLEIKSSDEFKHQQQYVQLERMSPKAKYSVMVWTEQPVLKGQIIVESDYKTRLDYSNDSSPFLIQMLWFIIPFGLIVFVATGVQIWFNWKHRIEENQKILERCSELQRKIECIDAKRQAQKDELVSTKNQFEKAVKESEAERKNIKRDTQEMRAYLLTVISQLRKELSFWRTTVRKLLYDSQNEFQTADKVIDTVTSTLKTYLTREHSDENMDELLYLAQLIANSKELHSKYDSTD